MMTDPDVILAALEGEFGPTVLPCVLYQSCTADAVWWMYHTCCAARLPVCEEHKNAYSKHLHERVLRNDAPKCKMCHEHFSELQWKEIKK